MLLKIAITENRLLHTMLFSHQVIIFSDLPLAWDLFLIILAKLFIVDLNYSE